MNTVADDDQLVGLRNELQATMEFLGALSSGLEQFIGRAANGMAFVAGKSMGRKCLSGKAQVKDPVEALKIVEKALNEQGFRWKYDLFPLEGESSAVRQEDDETIVRLVFRDCMIRQTLFRYGHAQQGSLCYMMYGFFAGASETVMGSKSNLVILHSGPNACLKELHLENR